MRRLIGRLGCVSRVIGPPEGGPQVLDNRLQSGHRSGHAVAFTENRRARDQYAGTGTNDERRRRGVDASIHLHIARRVEPFDQRAHPFDLRHRGVNELLMTEARIDRHDQYLVHVVDDFLQHAGGVAGWIATPARLPSELIRCTVRCRWWLPSQCTRSESDPASANETRSQSGSETIRCVSRGRCVTPRSDFTIAGPIERFGTNRSVHHVDVDAIRSSLLCLDHLLTETSEVGGEDRRGQLDDPGHTLLIDRGLEDALNGGVEHRVVLVIGLLHRQPFDERARETRDDAVISPQALVAFSLRIAAGERHHSHDLGMRDQFGVEVVSLRQRDLDQDRLARLSFSSASRIAPFSSASAPALSGQ